MNNNIVLKQEKGFTLVEILVSLTIFIIITLISIGAFVQIIMAQRKADLARTVYEEANFLMEKMVKEIRNNTLDYAFYYLEQNSQRGLNYYDYLKEPPYRSNAVVEIAPQQDILAMVSPDGKTRTMFWRDGDSTTGSDQAADPVAGGEEYQAVIKRMTYLNGGLPADDPLRNDIAPITPEPSQAFKALPREDPFKPGFTGGIMNWAWHAAAPFPKVTDAGGNLRNEASRIHNGWEPISAPRVNITSLRFLIWPQQDPYQFWDTSTSGDQAEEDSLLQNQVQPYVTIMLTVAPSKAKLQGIAGPPPTISLQTTVSTRLYQAARYQGWPASR